MDIIQDLQNGRTIDLDHAYIYANDGVTSTVVP
jgi:hypothetical protein